MEKLDYDTQLEAVGLVLEEMRKLEEHFESENVSWQEEYYDAYCLPLHYEIGEADVRDMQAKYGDTYKLSNAFYFANTISVPLARKILIGNNTLTGEYDKEFRVDFGRIEWPIISKKMKRRFSFNCDGTIKLSKTPKSNYKFPREIFYDTSYNVLSDNFDVSIGFSTLIDASNSEYQYSRIELSLKDNILFERFNALEIQRNLTTGIVTIKPVMEYGSKNGVSMSVEIVLNSEGTLKNAAIVIKKKNKRGKVCRTYRFDISSKKGLRISFADNPELQKEVSELLPIIFDDVQGEDLKVFVDPTLNDIIPGEKIEVPDVKNKIDQIENSILNEVKGIKGELLLSGLIDRIDNCLEKVDKSRGISKKSSKRRTISDERSSE